MQSFSRLILVRTRAEAWLLVAAVALAASILSSGVTVLIAWFRGQPLLSEAIVGFFVAFCVAPMLTWPVAWAALILRARECELERQALTDPMTGVLNRRGFFAAANVMFEASDPVRPACAILVDLDDFKTLNDTYGHAAGDEALVAVAKALSGMADGHGGVVGRLGGDEFCVMIPRSSEHYAEFAGERLRGSLGALLAPYAGGIVRVSASVGVVERQPDDARLDALLGRADAALYATKSRRRNAARPGVRLAAAGG